MPAAGRAEIAGDRGHRRTDMPINMQRMKRQAHALVEPFLDKVIDHLEIARIEDNARRVAMTEADFYLAGESCGHDDFLIS
ncbi:hypothetical protein D3C78_1476300 [compost metagenome]